MTRSVGLNLNLHHNGSAIIADVTHPATNTTVRCNSLADLVRVIHEQGDSLRPAQTGQWESLLATAPSNDAQDEASLSV